MGRRMEPAEAGWGLGVDEGLRGGVKYLYLASVEWTGNYEAELHKYDH